MFADKRDVKESHNRHEDQAENQSPDSQWHVSHVGIKHHVQQSNNGIYEQPYQQCEFPLAGRCILLRHKIKS